MLLHEHPDFVPLVLRTSEHFAARRLTPAAIEKDYYLSEALRAVAQHGRGRVLFKGGTSLSKGWNLIERFSEDIDLFFDVPLSSSGGVRRSIDRELEALCGPVRAIPGFDSDASSLRKLSGKARSERFQYRSRVDSVGGLSSGVLLEVGTASGREPSELRPLRSYVVEFLQESSLRLGAENESAFEMRLLHFRRTFVEKLFAIHSKVCLLVEDGRPLGSYARHYYDLAMLARTNEVRDMLASEEFEAIREDYDRVARQAFPRDYRPPLNLRFSRSPALFPGRDLDLVLAAEYERQCRLLCFGPYPGWSEVRQVLETLRPLL